MTTIATRSQQAKYTLNTARPIRPNTKELGPAKETPKYGRKRCYVFFFQAEDGIRDLTVTGVQTCALPISGRHDHPPVDDRRIEQVVDADRERLQLVRADQDQGEEEVVPGQDEREDPGRDDARQGQREHHVPDGPAAVSAVHERRLLEFEGDALEERAEEPQAERQTERRVREDQRQMRVHE